MNSSRVICTIVLLLTFCFSFTNSGQAQEPQTFCSTDVPISIPSGEGRESVLNVPDIGEVESVVVKLYIGDQPFRVDTEVLLRSPESDPILLFAEVGGNGDDFGTTCQPMPNFVLDDAASEPVSDFTSGDPAAGTYRPDDPLSLLIGGDVSGEWTLSISDSGGAFGATLNCWCLEFNSTPSTVRAVPTISQWGMIAFAAVLGVMGALFIHSRRKRAAV